VSELLARLHDRGHRIAVCTNKSERLARELLDRVGLARFVRTVVGADTCGRRKPDPAPLRLALGRLDAAACEAVLVGDSVVDRDCAGAAGVCCLIFEGGYGATQAQGPLRFADYEGLLSAEPAFAPRWHRERATPG
jgi:phosphoglycolate phosphatase